MTDKAIGSKDASGPEIVVPITVLVVDDEPGVRDVLRLTLSMEGLEVSTVADGISALDALKESRPDVILLDIMMPRLDGYDVLDRIRQSEHGSRVQVILMSAKSNDDDVWEGWTRGADSYITKPFDIQLVADEIRRVTAKSRRRSRRLSGTAAGWSSGEFLHRFSRTDLDRR